MTQTMNKKASPCNVAVNKSKKAKKVQRSNRSAQSKKEDGKQQSSSSIACSQLSPDQVPTNQKHSVKEVESTQVDCRSSHQHEMEKTEDDKGEIDLYRGADEIEEELLEKHQSKSVGHVPVPSVSAAEDPRIYSEREWKGNTTKSQLIQKGYKEIACKFNLRRVRGDNYCALRATLFQILSSSVQLPAWLQDVDTRKRSEANEELIKEWRLPFESSKNNTETLEHCLDLLKLKWQDAVRCKSLEQRDRLCQQIFMGDNEEYELLEALKFLMLKTSIHLHSDMENGSEVPEFCWLLFARDSSKNPKDLATNHLRHVGFSGGLEQVEMCLLGHCLQQTILVYRLYKFDTEEFITYYPNNHKEDWPYVLLLTEDDRHYNALVPKTETSSRFDEYGGSGKAKWKQPSGGQSNKTTRL